MSEVAAGSTTEAPTGDAPAAGAVDVAADPLASPTILGDAPASTEGGDQSAEAKEGEDQQADAPAGAPEAYDLKAPEGMTLDTDAVKLAEPVFKELGLSNEQAQRLTDLYPSLIQRVQQAGQTQMAGEIAAVRSDWAKAAQNDPTIGGAKLEETTHLAAKAIDASPASEDFRKFLNETGLGNHPEMLRMMSFYGAQLSEDGFIKGGATAPLSREEKFYGRRSA